MPREQARNITRSRDFAAGAAGSAGQTLIPGGTVMANELNGKKIAFLVANEGIEQVELTEPWKAVEQAGGAPDLIAPKPGKAQAFNHLDKADTFSVDRTTAELQVEEYDGVMLPGGVANPDQLRLDEPAVSFLREWVRAGRPVAVICHGPWTLVEADVVRGRTFASWPSLKTDIRNAGGNWVDEEVHVDGNIVSSRKPADLPAFCTAMVELFATGSVKGRSAA
jgi:protease I